MARSTPERRRKARVKAGFSVYYVIFLIFVYGPMFSMFTLSFQGPRAGSPRCAASHSTGGEADWTVGRGRYQEFACAFADPRRDRHGDHCDPP